MPSLKIAGLNISFNCPARIMEPRLLEFACDNGRADCRCDVLFQKKLQPSNRFRTILESGETTVSSSGDSFYFYSQYARMHSAVLASRDWTKIKIYLDSAFEKHCDAETMALLRCALMDSLITAVISHLMPRGGVFIHSATIIWNGKGIVFSAPSGTGKTTHTDMWCERYGVKVLDGDVTACRIVDGKPRVYGLPWCGESGKYLNECVPLGAVVFLEQSAENSITKLTVPEAVMQLYARCFLYVLEEETADRVLETVISIVSVTDCYLLKCRPDIEAVEIVKECLEKA